MALTASLSALTRDKFIPVLVDNIFNSNVLCFKLLKNAEKLDGGVKIITPIENIISNQRGWIGSGGNTYVTALGTTVEVAEKAEWEWATAFSTIAIEGDVDYKNRGSSQVLSLLKAKLKNAEKSMRDLFGTALFNAGVVDANSIISLNGAGTVVSGDYQAVTDLAATPTNSTAFHAPGNVDNSVCGYDRTLGGINSDSLHYWDAQIMSFSQILAAGADNVAPTFAEWCSTTSGVADGVKKMTQMYGACSIDADQPDLIVTTQVMYDAYESALQANKRFQGTSELADAGFQSLQFKGASVVVDSHCPAGHMYFLNTDYLDFKVHSQRNFQFEDFKRLEGKDIIQARMFWMGQLTCTNPRMQGLVVGGPTGY